MCHACVMQGLRDVSYAETGDVSYAEDGESVT